MFAEEGIELHHQVSITKPLDIVTKTQQALNSHPLLHSDRFRRLLLEICYYEYTFCVWHTVIFATKLSGILNLLYHYLYKRLGIRTLILIAPYCAAIH